MELTNSTNSLKNTPLHPLLDSTYLMKFYEGDIEEVLWSITTFYNFTLKDFFKLLPLAMDNNWHSVKSLAHKLKSNFKIAGLTSYYDHLYQLENANYNDPFLLEQHQKMIYNLDRDMKLIYKPILEQEINRLNDLLNKC